MDKDSPGPPGGHFSGRIVALEAVAAANARPPMEAAYIYPRLVEARVWRPGKRCGGVASTDQAARFGTEFRIGLRARLGRELAAEGEQPLDRGRHRERDQALGPLPRNGRLTPCLRAGGCEGFPPRPEPPGTPSDLLPEVDLNGSHPLAGPEPGARRSCFPSPESVWIPAPATRGSSAPPHPRIRTRTMPRDTSQWRFADNSRFPTPAIDPTPPPNRRSAAVPDGGSTRFGQCPARGRPVST